MKLSKKIAMILSLAAISAGAAACVHTSKVNSVSVKAFEEGIESPEAQILDVRTPEEYAEAHIEGAKNIDIYRPDFMSEAEKSLSKSRPVYVYCRSGRRSLDAAEKLAKKGFRVINLEGGIIDWTDKGMRVVDK